MHGSLMVLCTKPPASSCRCYTSVLTDANHATEIVALAGLAGGGGGACSKHALQHKEFVALRPDRMQMHQWHAVCQNTAQTPTCSDRSMCCFARHDHAPWMQATCTQPIEPWDAIGWFATPVPFQHPGGVQCSAAKRRGSWQPTRAPQARHSNTHGESLVD
jgi:hypothetical protein